MSTDTQHPDAGKYTSPKAATAGVRALLVTPLMGPYKTTSHSLLQLEWNQ